MPARIVMLHDEVAFLAPAATAIKAAGHDVAIFEDPMAALSVLEGRHHVELLITGVIFALVSIREHLVSPESPVIRLWQSDSRELRDVDDREPASI
jgi:hypothetical protein